MTDITTKEQLAAAVKQHSSDLNVAGKLADNLRWSMLSSQTSLFVRIPLIIILLFVIFVASVQFQNFGYYTIPVKVFFIASLILLVSSIVADIWLAASIGYVTAKTIAGRYKIQSYQSGVLQIKLRRDI